MLHKKSPAKDLIGSDLDRQGGISRGKDFGLHLSPTDLSQLDMVNRLYFQLGIYRAL